MSAVVRLTQNMWFETKSHPLGCVRAFLSELPLQSDLESEPNIVS